MSWRPGRRGGWLAAGAEREPVSNVTQVLKGVLQVAPGGAIRAGKKSYSDDATVGFWLGVDSDKVAKLNLGGATHFVKWSGTRLEVAGAITGALSVNGGAIIWGGGKGRADDTGLEHVEDSRRFWKLKPDSDRFLWVLGGNGYEGSAIEAYSERGAGVFGESSSNTGVAGQSSTGVGVLGVSDYVGVEGLSDGIGVQGRSQSLGGVAVKALASGGATALVIGGGLVDGGSQRYTNLADATAGTDGLNRQTGDGRYVQKSAGASGSFKTADGRTVTVTNGQITSIV